MHKTDTETLTHTQRWLELFIVAAMIALLIFFGVHQVTNTGFFTDEFGTFEQLCLYIPIVVACLAPAVRAFTGRRNPGRLFEAIGALCLAFGSLWLLIIFPFNYTHLANALPYPLRFLLAWITDDIARIVIVVQIVIAFVSSIVFTWQYLAIRARTSYTLTRGA